MGACVCARAMAGRAWYDGWYNNGPESGNIEKYMATTEPWLVEVMAVRAWQCLNCNASLDWSHENCVVATIRTTAPAFRLSYFLTGVYMLLLSYFYLDHPIVFRYDLFTESPDKKAGDVTVGVCFFLWALDFFSLAAGYYFARVYGKGGWLCFTSVTGYRPRRWLLALLYGVFFLIVACVGIVSTHTVLSHMWQKKNGWFVALLLLQCVMVVVGALGDMVDTGSPWGMQEASRIASTLLGFRGFVLVPATVIWSLASIAASFPPSWCAEC